MSKHDESDRAVAESGSDINWRIIAGIVVAAMAAIFILQNTTQVPIKFLIWDFRSECGWVC